MAPRDPTVPAAPSPRTPTRRPPGSAGRHLAERGSREAILEAARSTFAEAGYERATIRTIAGGAGVDPALVLHYFGSKAGLFAAALQLPVAPGELVAGVLADPSPDAHARLGETVVRAFLAAWEPAESRKPLVAMLRSALTNEIAQRLIRAYLANHVFAPLTKALGVPDAELRATLVGSQFVGLATMRYVMRMEPMASAPPEWIAQAVGPTIQRYLTGPLPPAPFEATTAPYS